MKKRIKSILQIVRTLQKQYSCSIQILLYYKYLSNILSTLIWFKYFFTTLNLPSFYAVEEVCRTSFEVEKKEQNIYTFYFFCRRVYLDIRDSQTTAHGRGPQTSLNRPRQKTVNNFIETCVTSRLRSDFRFSKNVEKCV